MPKRAMTRLHAFSAMIRLLLPAWAVFLLAGLIAHPLCLVLLLAANAMVMTGVCRAIGFDREATFARSIARRGLAYFVMLTAYTAFVAVVLAGPAWWLGRDGSLPAALAMSTALVVALLALWRVWPAFSLPLLWDDAYPRDDARGSWLLTALQRSLAFARHLTREHELFFVCGLPVGMGLLFLAAGALALSGFAGFLTGELRIAALILYAVVVAPMIHLLLVNRSFRALLADARSARRLRRAVSEESQPDDPVQSPVLPAGVARDELDATLICAARSAQMSLALAALERGADPNAMPRHDQRDQRSVLMIAVTLPDLRLLRALIARGVDVNKIQGGITPLVAAVRDSYEGRPDAVTMLLANGADARMADAGGNTPLHYASRCAEPIIAALLVDAAAEVNAVNADGLTPLCIACSHANWALADFLLGHGAKPDLEAAQPALIHAAGIAEDDPFGIRLLLRQRAAVNAGNALGRTALMTAALAGHSRIMEALLGSGADTDLADSRGTTALMEAARSGAVAAIHALGKRKPQMDRVDQNGRTALMVACQSRHSGEDAVRALLALGADRAMAGADGKRAVDHAASAGRWHIVALIDSAYPLPSTLAGEIPAAHDTHADHLLDALRFGHWNVAAEFIGVLGQWPAAALADLYLELVDSEHDGARAWLLNHGLDPNATTSTGGTLTDALVARLPASLAALEELLARGAAVGGAALLARVLASVVSGPEVSALRRLAGDVLARGGDWCGCAPGDLSPLHLAVANGHVNLVSRLLDLGSDPNARDMHGRTALHMALGANHEHGSALLRLLISAGADPEIATANGETPLGLALAHMQGDAARWLDWTTWRLPLRRLHPSDLPAAAVAGDFEATERLIELGLPVDGVDAQGATALIRAAGSGHVSLVVRLLEAGADATCVAHSGIHCLAAAVSARREAVVRTLLSHGIAADLRLAGGGTALTLAAAIGETRIAEALLEAGADANAADELGATPLHAAAQFAFTASDTAVSGALFEVLLRAGARLDTRNNAGQDALLILVGARAQAGARCDAEHLRALAGFLLEHGAKADCQDQRGVTALHACAMHGLFGCARLLKSHGAPLDAVDGFDRRAAEVAALLGYVDVAAELGGERPATAVPPVRQTLRRPARAPD